MLDGGVHVKSGAFSKYNPEPPKPLSQNAIVVIRIVVTSVLPMIDYVCTVVVCAQTSTDSDKVRT